MHALLTRQSRIDFTHTLTHTYKNCSLLVDRLHIPNTMDKKNIYHIYTHTKNTHKYQFCVGQKNKTMYSVWIDKIKASGMSTTIETSRPFCGLLAA